MDTCGVFLLLLFCVCVAGTVLHLDSGTDLHLELSIGHRDGGKVKECKNGSKEVGEADQHVLINNDIISMKTNQHHADCNMANDLDQLQTSYNILNEHNDNLQARYNQMKSSFEHLQSGYNNITEQKGQLQTSFDHLQTSHNNLTEHNDNLQSSYNQIQSRFEQLQSRYNNITEQKDLLHTGFDQLRHSYKNLTGHNDNLQSSFEQLQSSFKQLQSRYNHVTEQNNQIQLALQSSHDNLEEQRELLQNSFDRLQSSHVNLTEGRDQIQSSLEQLQFSHNNLTEHSDYLQARYNQIKSSFEHLQSGYNNITEQKGQLQSTFDQLQIIRNNLTEEIEQIQYSFNQLQISHHNLSEEKNQIQSRLDKLIGITEEAKSRRCELPGWRLDGDVCYYISYVRNTWEGSRNECRARLSDLIIMNSTEKKELVDRVSPSNYPMWIGLSDRKHEGDYTWVDETPLATEPTFWFPGQPHNYFGGEEDCVYYYHGRSGLGWIDRPCTGRWYFMCEMIMQ